MSVDGVRDQVANITLSSQLLLDDVNLEAVCVPVLFYRLTVNA